MIQWGFPEWKKRRKKSEQRSSAEQVNVFTRVNNLSSVSKVLFAKFVTKSSKVIAKNVDDLPDGLRFFQLQLVFSLKSLICEHSNGTANR